MGGDDLNLVTAEGGLALIKRILAAYDSVYIVDEVIKSAEGRIFKLSCMLIEADKLILTASLCGEGETFAFTQEDESSSTAKYSNTVGAYLYEPNAAIQKAGCYRSIAACLGADKLHPNSQLYTSGTPIEEFPGRTFTVEKVYGFSKSELKEIQALKKANITVRNFPDSVQTLRKRLKLCDGGEHYLFATTVADGSKVLAVCKKAI